MKKAPLKPVLFYFDHRLWRKKIKKFVYFYPMQKVKEIFTKVHDLSQKGKIQWLVDNKEKTAFKTLIADYHIHIHFNTMVYVFNVIDKNEHEIAKAFKAIVSWSGNSELPLEDLYELAKRKALNIDNSLDDLINNLNKI